MKVELTGGRIVHVGVRHVSRTTCDIRGTQYKQRGTEVWIRFGDGTTTNAMVWCYSGDKFCKATGRRLAGNKLLAGLRQLGWFSKEDRKRVFQKICPNLVKV